MTKNTFVEEVAFNNTVDSYMGSSCLGIMSFDTGQPCAEIGNFNGC